MERPALVIVDVQNDFCHPDGALARRGVDTGAMPAVAAANQRLVDACHACGAPVFFVRTEHGPWTDSTVWRSRVKAPGADVDQVPVCAEGGWGAEPFRLRPEARDRVVVKRRYSGFYGTDLEVALRSLSRVAVVITGVATNVCVEATVRDAFMRDFDTVVVPEACAANTPREHEMGLHNIGTYFGRIRPLADLLGDLRASADGGRRLDPHAGDGRGAGAERGVPS